MKNTSEQESAIKDQHRGNLLVSASAGSGKTKVLVDRVVDRLIHHHVRIDHLLIVTFTRAAAKEMKTRIKDRIHAEINSGKLALQSQDWLLTQLRRLPVAEIGTLDSFCQRIVEHYYYVTGLDPHFRILTNSAEIQMIRDRVWQTVRENFYANDPSFVRLVQNFAGRRMTSDDSLTELVNQLYDYAEINVDAKGQVTWLDQLAKLYQPADSITKSTFYQHYLAPQLRKSFSQVELSLKGALQIAHQNGLKRDFDFEKAELTRYQRLIKKLKTDDWDQLRSDFQNFARSGFKRLSGRRGAPQVHQQFVSQRNSGKKQFRQVVDHFFEFDEQQNLRIISQSRDLIDELVKVVKSFAKAYHQAKLTRHALEFIDVEHEALKILLSNNQEGRTVRSKLQRHFSEIMIDEYQDNNRLQDLILQMVAHHDPATGKADNVFMVGDVKQSIYRFRLADPRMFVHKAQTYQPLSKTSRTSQIQNCEVKLTRNFRSTARIDQFINLIFNHIMDENLGWTKYQPLVAGTHYQFQPPVQVLIYCDQSQSKNYNSDHYNDRFQIEDSAHGQIELVAQQIEKLINQKAKIYDRHLGQWRPIRYSDVAIISATRNNNLVIDDVFRRRNLPVTINGTQSYFKTTEIQIMMSLLEVIDNPYQDIPLAAVLRSPIVGLNENQLAYLRINSKTGDYYQAVCHFFIHYVPGTNHLVDQLYSKIKIFMHQLDHFRNVAKQHELVDLIWEIYEQTGFLDYVGGMPAGSQRQANLHALYERAADYEQTNFKGLFQFVRFVHRMQNQQEDLSEAEPNHSSDSVKVTTIHGSKGLEYPVVFLIDASHNFNQQDLRQSYVLNDRLGLGIKYFDSQRYLTCDTLQDRVITDQEKQADLSEEVRKLYVALTRAEQRLFIVGAAKTSDHQKLISRWKTAAIGGKRKISLASRSKAKNDLDWLGPVLVQCSEFTQKSSSARFHFKFVDQSDLLKKIAKRSTPSERKSVHSQSLNDDQKRLINRIMNFRDSHPSAVQNVNYQSVSNAKRLFEDPEDSQLKPLKQNGHSIGKPLNQYSIGNFAVPKFIQSAQHPKATQIGTATHLVLQMINLNSAPTISKINQQIAELVADQLIAPAVAKRIQPEAILAFFNSSFGQMVLRHPNDYHREVPFSLLINANLIYRHFKNYSGEKVLIHGIIDGYLDVNGQVMIVDYKTDSVNRKDLARSIARIKDRYRGQLNLYEMALNSIINRPVKQKYLYLLSIHRLVSLDDK